MADTSSEQMAPELFGQLASEVMKMPARVWKEMFAGLLAYDDLAEIERITAGIAAADEESFWELRRRLVQRGCTTGEVMDFGPVLGFDFTDPDGMSCEVDLALDATLSGNHAPRPYAGATR